MKQNLSILTLFLGMVMSGHVFGQTYSSSGSITVTPDGNCPGVGAYANSTINVTGTGTISNASNVFINTKLDILCSATFKLVLVAPNGDSCILLNMPYRSGPCTGECFTAQSTNTLSFNSTFTNPYPQADPAPTGNYAPTASTYYPQIGNLSTFLAGKSISGNWRLAASADADAGGGISSWSIVFGSTALPLDLIGFSGYTYSGYNELKWSTASEKNTASFDVQRSVDGVEYQTIGTVRAEGSGSNHYRFQDENSTSDVNMYRLRMIDRDGSYAFSKNIVKLSGKTGKGGSISFAPNPVKDILNLTISKKELLHTEAHIINSLGQTVYTFKIDQERIPCSLGHLQAGIYFIQLKNGDHYRFVKEN